MIHCTCNGVHFKVAVAVTFQKWIVHNGMHGWEIGDHGDKDFGAWFQGDKFSIVQIVYEMIPDDGKTISFNRSIITHYCINTLAQRALLEMSNVIWKSREWSFSDLENAAVLSIIKNCDVKELKRMKESYKPKEWKSFLGLQKLIAEACDSMINDEAINEGKQKKEDSSGEEDLEGKQKKEDLSESMAPGKEQKKTRTVINCDESGKKETEKERETEEEMGRKKNHIQEQQVKEPVVAGNNTQDMKNSFQKSGYAILEVPKKLKTKLNQTIHKIFPATNSFQPIFTCRKDSNFVSEDLKKMWMLNPLDGVTYFDGKREQAKLWGFDKEQAKQAFEEWLVEVTGREKNILVDVKILRTKGMSSTGNAYRFQRSERKRS